MSLREDYSGVCTGGFHDDMAVVFQAGVDFVGTATTPGVAYPQLQTALNNSSTAGVRVFTVTIDTTFEPDNLRLNGIHQQTYFAGIIDALSHEGIYGMYVNLKLNVSDTLVTSVDFNFIL